VTAGVVFVNGLIRTMGASDQTRSAVAVADGRIVRVGSDEEVRGAAVDGVHVVDLRGQAMIPGLIDGHNHFSRAAFEPAQVDCSTPPITSLGEVLRRITEHAASDVPGRWIRGWGFHWSRVRERRNPTRAELDGACPENPFVLMDASYHGCFANSRALEAAGIDRHSPPGRSGILVLDEAGEPTGALFESAIDLPESLSWQSYLDRSPGDALAMIERHAHRLLAHGITGVSDALVLPSAAALYRVAADAGRLPLTVHQMYGGRRFFESPRIASLGDERLAAGPSDHLRGGTLKIFMDAVHPSPAIDRPAGDIADAHTGVNFYSRGEALELVTEATAAGLQVAIHALGNCAVEQSLETYAAVRRTSAGRDASLRIEHFVLANEAQCREAAELGVTIVTNPGFVHRWGDQYLERWRWDGRPDLKVLPLRTLLDAGVTVAAASDHPCDDLDPFHGMWAAVERRSWTGDSLFPEEAVTRSEALRMYTASAAAACGQASDAGSIEVGKRANLVVLDRDPITCATGDLPDTAALQTYIDGVLAFQRAESGLRPST